MEESYASGLSDLRIVSNDFRLDSRILSQNSKSEFLRHFENLSKLISAIK